MSATRRRRVLALLGAAFFMTILDGTSLLTALPSIENDLRLGGPAIQWTVTAYALAFTTAGAVTVTLAMALLVYAITEPPSPIRTTVPLAAGLALAALFVRIEGRSAAPLVPFRALRSRMLIGGNLVVLFAGMTVDGMLVTLTAYAQQVLGWSAVRFGLVAAAMTVSAAAGGMVGQRSATRFGVRRVAAVGTFLLAGACALLARVSPGGPAVLILIALPVFGVGMGAVTVCQIAALTGVAERDSGLAAGVADTSFAVGTALRVAVCGSVVIAAGAGAAFAAAGLFACLGMAAALMLLIRHPEHRLENRREFDYSGSGRAQ